MRYIPIVCSCLLLSVPPLAAAPFAALTFDGGSYSASSNGQSQTFGWAFRVEDPIVVTALGLFDLGADGFADPHELGLWRETGAYTGDLLRSTTMPEGTVAPVQGGFRYVAITPIALEAHTTYVVGAHFTGIYGWGSLDPDPEDRDGFNNVYSPVGATLGPSLEFVGGYSSSQQTTGMSFPYANTSGWTTYPIMGPTFLYEAAVTSVPESGATVAWVAALAGLAVLERCRRRVAFRG